MIHCKTHHFYSVSTSGIVMEEGLAGKIAILYFWGKILRHSFGTQHRYAAGCFLLIHHNSAASGVSFN